MLRIMNSLIMVEGDLENKILKSKINTKLYGNYLSNLIDKYIDKPSHILIRVGKENLCIKKNREKRILGKSISE